MIRYLIYFAALGCLTMGIIHLKSSWYTIFLKYKLKTAGIKPDITKKSLDNGKTMGILMIAFSVVLFLMGFFFKFE